VLTTLEELARTPLADLTGVPLDELAAGNPTLEEIVRRITDPANRDKLTVSKFQSAL